MNLTGVLFFPVTPFDENDEVDHEQLTAHIDSRIKAGCGAVFAACGTGEFSSLSPAESAAVVATAVHAAKGRVPVFAGAGASTTQARQQIVAAHAAGASGILLFPPYLTVGTQAGLVSFVHDIAESSPLPLIVYQRDRAVFSVESARQIAQLPNVIGFKDGHGDLELISRQVLAIRAALDGEDFLFFNGLPTAEVTMGAYRGAGVNLYSSAVFAFAPEIAGAFYTSFYAGDEKNTNRLLTEFFLPFVELRDSTPGYSVALVKAGVQLRQNGVGEVRPPLVHPSDQHVSKLSELLEHGLKLVESL